MMSALLVGYRFRPTDEEVVKEYLIKRARGDELPSPVIKDVDVYAHNPDNLSLDIASDCFDTMRWAYFFSFRKHKYGSICSRSTQGGYWKVSGRETSIRDGSNEMIAFKRRLVFYWGIAPHGTKTEYMMEEFRLNQDQDQLRNPAEPDMDDCVVCKVYTRNLEPRIQTGARKRKIGEDMKDMIDDEYS